MKKMIIVAAALLGIAAQADVGGPLYGCQLKGTMAGNSVGVGLSVTQVEGIGTVSCKAINGVTQEVGVKIKLTGVGVGLGYSEYTAVEVVSGVIGVADASALVGTYSVGASAGVTLIEAGLDVGAALKVSNNGLGFELGLMGKSAKGLEAKVQLQSFEVTALQ